jgi:peptide/nickel transport system substrate-binding protein
MAAHGAMLVAHATRQGGVTMITRRQFLGSALALAGATDASILAAPRAASAQAGGKVKSELTFAIPSNPETIDPHQFRSVLTSSILTQVTEGLLTRDPRTMAIQPLLAVSYRNVNPRTWEFKLRRGVKFQNGEDFNAESVKFSLERIISSKVNALGRTVWPPSFGQRAEIVDSHTVHIVTEVPDPIVPNRLAAESLNMAPPQALAAFKDKPVGSFLVGTGPYKFVEFVPGDRIVIEANPAYWGPKPATPRIVWKVIPDDATRMAALQRGAVDIIMNLPVPFLPQTESDPNIRLYAKLGSIVQGLLLNARESTPLKDRRVRQALNYAVDKEALLKGIYRGHGVPISSVVARQVPGWIDTGVYPYDPAKARQLLGEAGYKDGFDLTVWVSIGRYALSVDMAQGIAGYLEKVGIRTNVQTMDWGPFNQRSARQPFKDCSHYGFVNGVWDPEYLTQRFLPSYPTFRYYDAEGELRQAIEAHTKEFNPAKRKALAARVEQGLRDEAVWLFLWQLDELFGLSKKVHGFEMRPDHVVWVRETVVDA